jgi:sulfatase modifying factor 1
MVLIPGGEFMMGIDNGDPDEAPPHSVSAAPFEMDKTEVTNAELAAFVEDTGYETEVERGGDFGSRKSDLRRGESSHIEEITYC